MELWVKILIQIGFSALGTYLWGFCIAMEYKLTKKKWLKKFLSGLFWVGPLALITSMIIDPIFDMYTWIFPGSITLFGGVFYGLIMSMALMSEDERMIQRARGFTLQFLFIFGVPFITIRILLLFMEPNEWVNSFSFIYYSFLLFMPYLTKTFIYMHKSGRITSKYNRGKITKEEHDRLIDNMDKDSETNQKIQMREVRLKTLLKNNWYYRTKVKWVKFRQKYFL